MKKLFLAILLIFTTVFGSSFEKEISNESKEAMENKKVKCRWVCDKKVYKEQRIAEAISFYKKTRDYNNSK